MLILRLISRLLDYPTDDLHNHLAEALTYVSESELDPVAKAAITGFIELRHSQSLLDWQSDYDGLFDRGRAVSLHLFEHIYGESRDRGQAMIHLIEHYKTAGLEISARELPDYLPLYLEFVATQPQQAQGWLQDMCHILALLKTRLEERESDYALLMTALIAMANIEVDYAPLQEQVAKEIPDNTPEALDSIWQEEVVSFTGEDALNACSSGRYRPSPNQSCDDVTHVTVKHMACSESNYSTSRLAGESS